LHLHAGTTDSIDLCALMIMSSSSRLEQLGRFLLRGLRIGASTVSIIELLRNDWTGGVSAGIAWLVFLQVERRLPPSPADPPSPGGGRF
jgi:hypothetical protein